MSPTPPAENASVVGSGTTDVATEAPSPWEGDTSSEWKTKAGGIPDSWIPGSGKRSEQWWTGTDWVTVGKNGHAVTVRARNPIRRYAVVAASCVAVVGLIAGLASLQSNGSVTQTASDQMRLVDTFVSKAKLAMPELEGYSDAQLGRWGLKVCSIALVEDAAAGLSAAIAAGDLPDPNTTGKVMAAAGDSLCPDESAALGKAAQDYDSSGDSGQTAPSREEASWVSLWESSGSQFQQAQCQQWQADPGGYLQTGSAAIGSPPNLVTRLMNRYC